MEKVFIFKKAISSGLPYPRPVNFSNIIKIGFELEKFDFHTSEVWESPAIHSLCDLSQASPFSRLHYDHPSNKWGSLVFGHFNETPFSFQMRTLNVVQTDWGPFNGQDWIEIF